MRTTFPIGMLPDRNKNGIADCNIGGTRTVAFIAPPPAPKIVIGTLASPTQPLRRRVWRRKKRHARKIGKNR